MLSPPRRTWSISGRATTAYEAAIERLQTAISEAFIDNVSSGGVGPKNVKESLVYEQLDCARNYHSTISLFSYGPNGQIVLSGSGNAEEEGRSSLKVCSPAFYHPRAPHTA
jgi:hypothetical protein